jgi:capsular polysaccharide transport system permease protein
MTTPLRNSLQITLSVWRAMFLREALDRLFEARAAWLWLLFEPIMWILIHVFAYLYLKHSVVGGMHVTFWTAIGFVVFLLWRRTYIQTMHAVDCNKAYFVYRQVKPFDAAFVRGFLELFLMVPIGAIVFALTALAGFSILPGLVQQQYFPADPLLVILAFAGLWLFGLGVGLILSVIMIFFKELDHINTIMFLPLFAWSGAIFPVAAIPFPYRNFWLANPVVHGIESARLGLLPSYHTDSSISLTYLYAFALGSVFLGLLLYRRFDKKLVMR